MYLFFLLILSACYSTPSLPQWQWERVEAGLPRQAIVLTVAAEGQHIWAGYYGLGGLATSRDGGRHWSAGSVGSADNPVFDLLALSPDLTTNTSGLWAATRDGLFQSLDRGINWERVSEGLPAATVFAMASDAFGRLYAGLERGEIYVWAGEGQGWQLLAPLAVPVIKGADLAQTDPSLAAILSLVVSADGRRLYAGTSGHGLLASQDGGQSWVKTYSGRYAPNIVLNPDDPAVAVASLRTQMVRTHDGGQSWHTLQLPWAEEEIVSLLWLADGTLGAGTGQGRLYYSHDQGASWIEGGVGLSPYGSILSLTTASTGLFAGTWTGLYASGDGGATWTNPLPALGTAQAQTLLATESDLLLGTRTALFRWEPEAQMWQPLSSYPPSGAASLAAHPVEPQRLYAGSSSDGVYRSDDGGLSWQALPSLQKGIPAIVVAPAHPDRLYALAAWERVYESQDGGQQWAARWEGLGSVIETMSLAADPLGSFVYVGTESGLYRSEGNQPWDLIAWELVDQSILTLLAGELQGEPALYIGATRGLYRSLDRGETLSPEWGQGLENISVTALLVDPENGSYLLAGTAYSGVYQSIDGGETWQLTGPDGIENEVVKAMAWGPGGELFMVTSGGVWRGRPVNNE